MHLSTDGIVIREVKTGEADKILAILTREKGVVSAAAKGSLRIKSKLLASSCLLAYSDFELYEGKSMYSVNEAQPLRLFTDIRLDISKLAVAMYMCELALNICPENEEADEYLGLFLNCLHLLDIGKRPPRTVKTVFELRLMTLAGYMPNLGDCEGCGAPGSARLYFDCVNGCWYCADCASQRGHEANCESSMLLAMRHIAGASEKRIFSYELRDAPAEALSELMSRYVSCRLERSFNSLEFFNSLPR